MEREAALSKFTNFEIGGDQVRPVKDVGTPLPYVGFGSYERTDAPQPVLHAVSTPQTLPSL